MNTEEKKSFNFKEHLISSYPDENYLKELESKGFYVAKVMLTAIEKYNKLEDLLKNYKEGMNLDDEILSIAADLFNSETVYGITEDFQDKCLNLANKLIEKNEEVSEFDKNARIVKVGLLLYKSSPDPLVFCEECLLKYPDVPYFYKIKMAMCLHLEKYEEGDRIGKEAVKKWPENLDIVFLYANNYQIIATDVKNGPQLDLDTGKLEEIERLFNNFIVLVPKDEPRIPVAYYYIAKSLANYAFIVSSGPKSHENEVMGLETMRNIRKFYEKGLEAEKLQMPGYTPGNDVKIAVESCFNALNSVVDFNGSGQMFIVGNGDNSVRLFKNHRVSIKAHRNSQNVQFEKAYENENDPELEKNSPHPSTKGFKTTLLPIIKKKWNHTYKGFYIEFTIVDDPDVNFERKEIGLLVHDNVNCLSKIVIDNVKNIENAEYIENALGFGCKIVISDPFTKVDQNGEGIIKVDDLKTLMITGEKDLKRCRYCGNSRGILSCAKCNRKYCSKECQVKDWKKFAHKLICELSK